MGAVLFPHAVNGDKQRNHHGEQGHVAKHHISLLNNGHQAHTGYQPAGQQKAHGQNKEFCLVAEPFSFPHSGPAVGEVVCKAGGSGYHGQYHNHPIDGGKHGRQVLPADQQDGRTRYDFRHKGKHNGAGHGKQECNQQADGDAGANGILLAPDLVGVVAKSGSPGRAGHAIGAGSDAELLNPF